MTRIPAITSRDLIKKLRNAGFEFDRHAKGSHEIWYHAQTKRRISIPVHPGKDLSKGTLIAIIEQTGFTLEEFLAL